MAAAGAVIGQTWVALTHVPWPPAAPAPLRVAAVLPIALRLELLAMALAAMADERMRLGERAYGFRVFAAAVVAVAVGILVARTLAAPVLVGRVRCAVQLGLYDNQLTISSPRNPHWCSDRHMCRSR